MVARGFGTQPLEYSFPINDKRSSGGFAPQALPGR
jgi:hypothetical protein